MEKLNVCIVFGGKSSEHEVSIRSSRSIYQAINKDKYNITLLGVTKTGSFLSLSENDLFANDSIFEVLSDSSTNWFQPFNSILEKVGNNIDVFFPIIHGKMGEDGSLQGFFEILNIPYVGPGVVGSAICMDKEVSKRLLKDLGIQIGKFISIKSTESEKDYLAKINEILSYPMFIKPANGGSSVGVNKAYNEEELVKYIQEAFLYDTKILVEEYIKGKEIEVSVMGNDVVEASLPGELIPTHEFYSYKAKYNDANGAVFKIPAEIPEEKIIEARKIAIQVFKTLECYGMARVDFFYTDLNELYVNEINTLPGFTSISMYPKLWEATNIKYSELIDKLIQLAIDKKKEKDKIKKTI